MKALGLGMKQIIIILNENSLLWGDLAKSIKAARENGIDVRILKVAYGKPKKAAFSSHLKAILQSYYDDKDYVYPVNIDNFSKSLTQLCYLSCYKTVEGTVNSELDELARLENLNAIHPAKRGKLLSLMDDLSNNINLKCLLLLDVSALSVEFYHVLNEAVPELLRYLKSREGSAELGIMAFPDLNNYTNFICPFTGNIFQLEMALKELCVYDGIPSSMAVFDAIRAFGKNEANDLPFLRREHFLHCIHGQQEGRTI